MRFIVPINRNSEIRLRRVNRSQASLKFVLRTSEIRPTGGCRSILQMAKTLRVSIFIKMDKTEGFAPYFFTFHSYF